MAILSVRGVSEEVQKALRIRAAETGETMGEIVERALRKELGMVETDVTIWQAWLHNMLMGEGATEQEAIEAAVAEYETSIGYGDEPHLFADREALVAALVLSRETPS